MKAATDIGFNRSGLATAPIMAPEMLEVVSLTVPSSEGDAMPIARERAAITKVSEPAVTMPPPGTLKELAKTTVKMLKGEKATTFIDKLGERLAFERSGVRLYEAIVGKLVAFGSYEGGPSRSQLETILEQEREHFEFLVEAMMSLGCDPTAVTPSANLHDVMNSGLRLVVTDPRVDLRQSLEAALVAELSDNDCWGTLAALAQESGEEQLAQAFYERLHHEEEHLDMVRQWLSFGLSKEAFGDAQKLPMPKKARSVRAVPARKAAAKRNVSHGPSKRSPRGRNVMPSKRNGQGNHRKRR